MIQIAKLGNARAEEESPYYSPSNKAEKVLTEEIITSSIHYHLFKLYERQ